MRDDIAWHDDDNDTSPVSIHDAALLSGLHVADLIAMMVEAGHIIQIGPDEFQVSEEALALGLVTEI